MAVYTEECVESQFSGVCRLEGYGGSISDKELTHCSEILDLQEQGDLVMADCVLISKMN